MTRHAEEVQAGQRFQFGGNWQSYLKRINPWRIEAARQSMREMLGSLSYKTFLDVGCGSGLSSLVANLDLANVVSFDYDPKSVACTRALMERHGRKWDVKEGSVLDRRFLSTLGQFDVVYSWGVLHHTGDMALSFHNVMRLVKPSGLLLIAIYNDQGWKSRAWRAIKVAYNRNQAIRFGLRCTYVPAISSSRLLARAIKGRLRESRGMSYWHDAVDWLGGYPFEVARPETVLEHFCTRGFDVEKYKFVGTKSGCNEFLFRRRH